jgi:alkyldihydroxyacetonephosphate synthase
MPPPGVLGAILTDEPYERCLHSYGRSFRDAVRGSFGQYPNPPDLVAKPASEEDVAAILDWCASTGQACIAFGGGSSVVGGVEPDISDKWKGVVSLDCTGLAGVLEIDRRSLAARVAAGTFGPALERELGREGLTFRHFPQSFEFSTVGGWIATRSGGHFATRYTHVDDLVESIRMITPAGLYESRRLPGSGAGPSPDRLVLGSEGTLGVVTQAWLRVRERPLFRAKATVRFANFDRAVEAVRTVSQSGLEPANCRLLDAAEAAPSGAGDGEHAVLLLGFESARVRVEPLMSLALECLKDCGGEIVEQTASPAPGAAATATAPTSGAAADSWRSSFMSAPYLRDALVLTGAVCETFETAITWDRFSELHAAVLEAAAGAFRDATSGKGSISCRFTHVYPDGPAPYFTVVAPGGAGAASDPSALLGPWSTIKQACSEAVLAAGGTITHHHAVGRDHREYYGRQSPGLFQAALAAAKRELDPSGMCNPGVLLPER